MDGYIKTHHILTANFIVGNLHSDVTPKQLYKSLGLHKFPSQNIIEVLLAVNKRGHSKGHAFIQIPKSCTSKFLKNDKCDINGQAIYICLEEGNNHMVRDKKWLKSYKDDGMSSCIPHRPRMIYKYTKTRFSSKENKEASIGPLWDMCADLTHRKFASELDKVVAHFYKLGVDMIVIPGRHHSQRQDALELVRQYGCYVSIYFSTGIAPQHANDYTAEEQVKIESELSMASCHSMGPIGLDYRMTNVSKEQQLLAFEEQVKLACDKQKAMYLEEHEAHEDFVSVLMKYNSQLPKCAIVDFSGNSDELQKYVSMGFYIVLSGSYHLTRSFLPSVITDALQSKSIPTDKVLLASNAPRKPAVKDSSNMGYCNISANSRNRVPLKQSRTEPLCVFLNLETAAKYLGYETINEIQEFGRVTVKNSKRFLGFVKDKTSVLTTCKHNTTGFKRQPKRVRKVNKLFVIFALSALLLGILFLILTAQMCMLSHSLPQDL